MNQHLTVSRKVARSMMDAIDDLASRPDDIGKAFAALIDALDEAQGNDGGDPGDRDVVISVEPGDL